MMSAILVVVHNGCKHRRDGQLNVDGATPVRLLFSSRVPYIPTYVHSPQFTFVLTPTALHRRRNLPSSSHSHHLVPGSASTGHTSPIRMLSLAILPRTSHSLRLATSHALERLSSERQDVDVEGPGTLPAPSAQSSSYSLHTSTVQYLTLAIGRSSTSTPSGHQHTSTTCHLCRVKPSVCPSEVCSRHSLDVQRFDPDLTFNQRSPLHRSRVRAHPSPPSLYPIILIL